MGALEDRFAKYPEQLSVEEVAQALSISMPTAYAWLKAGKIPAYNMEGKWLILRDEVLEYLRARRNTPPGHPAAPAGTTTTS